MFLKSVFREMLLFSARFSLIITTLATPELPQNGTKKNRDTRGYTQRLSIKGLNIPRMFGLMSKSDSHRLKCKALDYQRCEDSVWKTT